MDKLVDMAQHRLEQASVAELQEHLGRCARCQENWQWIQKILQVTAQDETVEPPRWVVHRAVQLFATHGPQPQPTLWQRITAMLVFDSLAQPALVATRDTEPTMRQLLYRAGVWDVDVSLEPGDAPDTIHLTGQVLHQQGAPRDVAGILVNLLQAGETVASTTTNSIGEFTFDQLAAGAYDLNIHTGDVQVWVEQMDVRLEA